MELSSIVLRIPTVDQKLVYEVWRPTKHDPFSALCGDCYDSCWSLFFPAFPQHLASHYLTGEPCHRVIDILEKNYHVSPVGSKLCLYYLGDLLFTRFVV
jgi:hypothetical protein